MQVVDAALELLDELQARADARQLRIELGRELAQPRRRLGAVVDDGHLAEHGVHLRLELRRAAEQRGRALAERFERRAIGRQLVAQLRRFGVRLVELANLVAQQVEILPRLLERLVLGDGAAADLVDLRQALAERLEHALLAPHLVGLRHQGLEVLAHHVGLGVHGRQQLVFREHAVHARFRFGDAGRQAAQPVIEGVEFLLVDRQPLDRRAEVLGEHAAFLVEPRVLARELLARRRGRRQLGMRFFGQLLHARHRVFRARHLLAALVELGDLHVHRPHHFVEAVGLDDGALDGVLLGLERLGLLRDVFGQGVERRETLFRVLAELLELHQRPELLLDFLHRLGRRRRIFPWPGARFRGCAGIRW